MEQEEGRGGGKNRVMKEKKKGTSYYTCNNERISTLRNLILITFIHVKRERESVCVCVKNISLSIFFFMFFIFFLRRWRWDKVVVLEWWGVTGVVVVVV